MQSRLSLGVAVMLTTLIAASTQMGTAEEPSRLRAFAARQDLCDEVCIAMADGQISRIERYTILLDAKEILKPDEYDNFKRTLNRISPPVPVVKRSAKQKKPQSMAKKDTPPVAAPSLTSTIVAEAKVEAETTIEVSWPDRVASADGAR